MIDDFETEVHGTYDFVDDVTYTVERMSGAAAIEHTDGAGMMLPNAFGVEQKNKMVRLPWVKGLVGVFDYKKFIDVHGCSPVIKDIYGKEHDVIAEDIQVIFTKSQFKLNKHYESWDDYKENYKKYDCVAGMTNVEEDRIKDATINYQMLQSLTDITNEEILEIAKPTIDKLNSICTSLEDIKRTIGITPYNKHKTAFQKAIELYPNLLNDKYAKEYIKNIKDSMVKRAKSGKLNVRGKYTFVLPDFYAACEHWFLGIEVPDGLLNDGEVFCWLFRKDDKLDCLRSPHLYREHPIRKNLACWSSEKQQELREWFVTDAIYISSKDLISRIVQADFDGDKLLVVADKKLIEVAERNMNDIVPLYYPMKKASSVHLDNASIYNGLNAAFVGGNIGIYSNNISKIWNSDEFINGADDDKHSAIEIIKLLCLENNMVIDYAKTLYKPERPKHINDEITKFTNELLPHFFKYAKNKKDTQVTARNQSFVNKLDGKMEIVDDKIVIGSKGKDVIPNPRINCKKLGLGQIDYTQMMGNPNVECKVALTDNNKIVKEETDPLIVRYCEFDREYHFTVDAAISCDDEQGANDKFAKKTLKYKQMKDRIKSELSQFGYDDDEITDVLVSFLYNPKYGKNRKNKTALWMCYGDNIVANLEKNLGNKLEHKREVQCVDCGVWFEVSKRAVRTYRCEECQKEADRNVVGEKTKTCTHCGAEFIAGSKSKTDLCGECYSKYRRKKKTKTMSNLRAK